MTKSGKTTTGTYRSWMKELAAGKIRPLYVLTGEERYLLRHGRHALEKRLLPPGAASVDLARLYAPRGSQAILNELDTAPFLAPQRLVEVEDSGLLQSGKGEEFLQLLAGLYPQNACLLLTESKVDKRQKKSLEALSAAGGMLVEFPKEPAETLLSWLAGRFRKAGLEISREAAESLLSRTDGALEDLAEETTKIILYARYTGQQQIDFATVDLLCRDDLRAGIFDLTDALSAADTRKALEILDRLLRRKEAAVYILFMLGRHFRQLQAAKSAHSASELATELSLPPFVGNRLFRQSRHFSSAELRQRSHQCYLMDRALKSTAIPERLALELLFFPALQ